MSPFSSAGGRERLESYTRVESADYSKANSDGTVTWTIDVDYSDPNNGR